ncbi:MAG: hypothetical protein JW807_09125 [Spirochaetes bacterium]|nr:hypothetical protein [Spirochaetota bacterium]
MEPETINREIDEALATLHGLNQNISGSRKSDLQPQTGPRSHRLQKVLVANRGEIAKRFFLALHEEGIPSVAVVTNPDRGQSWYEFADEVVFIGDQDNYASIPVIIAAALLSKANAIYSGYGFLSENIDFVEAISAAGRSRGQALIFMGPGPETMRQVGNKMNARLLASRNDIPLFESSGVIPGIDLAAAAREASRIGYPVMVKPCSGGGGMGVYVSENESGLAAAVESASRIGKDLYGDPSFYIEQFVRKPVHIEVQIFNGWAIGIRKCAVQRRNQKIIEESGHAFLDNYLALSLLAAAEKIAHISGYGKNGGAGTVEFLINTETGKFGFMEMNTRLQVEYAVTDQSLGIDIAKWQILFYDGREQEIIGLETLKSRVSENNHSIECRIYAEEPENDYLPSPGTIIEMDLPTFNGIRCDFGFMDGDSILPMYDPMIGKLIAHGATRREAIIRLERALQELYINGVKTNINQLLRIVRHPEFASGGYTNNLLEENPYLNFREPDNDTAAAHDRRTLKHVMFGAFAEHMRVLHQSLNEFIVIANLGGIVDAPSSAEVPYRYILEHRGRRHHLEFMQTSIDSYCAFVNGVYNGKITLTSMNDRCDDFLLIFGSSSYRIRVNRHDEHLEIRMKDEGNKINYFHMRVIPEGIADEGTVRKIVSPFQGAFVSFCRQLKKGDTVRAGEPLIVLSSMKMETAITAPEAGRIAYIIEDGDPSKMQVSRTTGGRIIGRSIQERELLAVIERETADAGETGVAAGKEPGGSAEYPANSIFDCLSRGTLPDAVAENLDGNLTPLFELIYMAAQGYIYRPSAVETLVRALERVPSDIGARIADDRAVDLLNAIILHYTDIKKLFSPVVSDEGLSFQEELGQYIAGREAIPVESTRPFERLLKTLFESYVIPQWDSRSELSLLAHRYIFVLFKRAYHFCLEHTDIIKKIVHIISNIRRPEKNITGALLRLMEQEEAERDDSLLKFIKKIVSSEYQDPGIVEYPSADMHTPPELANLYMNFRGQFTRDVTLLCRESLAATGSKAHAGTVPEPLRGHLSVRTSLLEKNYRIKTLFSPSPSVVMYRLESTEDQESRSYIALTACDSRTSTEDPAAIEAAFNDAAGIIQLYQQIEACGVSWIEVLARGRTLSLNTGYANGEIRYADFKNLCASISNRRLSGGPIRSIITIDVRYPYAADPRPQSLVTYRSNDSVVIELLLPMDRNNPYRDASQVNIADQRLLDIGKWPIEAWAGECFDPGSIREIRIPSIDETRETQATDLQLISRPVGSKIFYGTIGGAPACFYMKDSRVSGGSTGSREGLKYIAAAYLSYCNDWPLYVWNDSAGANIMEGIISLNRGAEGFMMNTLLTERAGSEIFRRYVENTADNELAKLFRELNEIHRLSYDRLDDRHRSFQLTAVGIGSSAGLDVYGSSQASIQILLDSEESYRVLTGSKVVHTVIGEEITNYEIGGAKILGTWTGIVDIVACNKLHLLGCIYTIHRMFCRQEQLPGIARPPAAATGEEKATDSIVFNESIIRANVDGGIFWPFKEGYYAADALIGGFAVIGGRRVLIMGPRTNSGIRSLASTVKAKELLRAAHRTSSHQILIFGKKWQQTLDFHEHVQMRPRLDFMNLMKKKSGLKINIITHPDGLKCFDINSAADAVIYIYSGKESAADSNFIRNNAVFLADSFAAAFTIAHRLITLIDPAGPFLNPSAGSVPPTIPSDASEAYDMVESVIIRVFDDGSFLEFYRDMNNPATGPNLITGLAVLEGRTVGVIADQPLVKGGGADAFGTEKFRVFTEFLELNRIPLVMLANSSGFVPGSQQERHRIQAIGAESLDANVAGTVPVVSVVLNQNYGGRLIHAFNKFLRPGIVYLALENAIMAVIGVDAAFDLLYGKKYARLIDRGETEQAEELRKNFAETYIEKARASRDGVESSLVDWTIPSVKDLREHIIKGLRLAFRRCNAAFGVEWPAEK